MSEVFHDLLVAELPKLRGAAFALTRSRANADDLVQITVEKALRAKSSFAIGTNMGAWLNTILYNAFISTVRRKKEVLADDHDISVDNRASVPAAAEDRLAVREMLKCMGKLSDVQRQALVLVVMQGLSYEEVARITGVAVGTAKCRVFRARKALQEMLLGETPAATDGDTADHEERPARSTRRREGAAALPG